MAKVTYEDVHDLINQLIEANREVGDGYEYAATTGTLASILSLLVGKDIKRADVKESLMCAIAQAKARS